MKKILRLTESELIGLIRESVGMILREDGEVAATPGATSDSADRQGAFDVPFGSVQRRKAYSPKGDKVSDGMTQVDMTDALKRHDGSCGSISIPKKRKQ